jgi:hypothetical protein
VEPKDEETVLSVDEAMVNLKSSAMETFRAETRLIGLLKKEGFLQ